MVRFTMAVLAIVLLAGCAETEFSKPGATAEEYKRDLAACRRQVNAQVSRDRNIDADIDNSLGRQAQQVRPGDTQTRQQMASRGDTVRTDRLMESCMRARGYSGAGDAAKQAPAKKP